MTDATEILDCLSGEMHVCAFYLACIFHQQQKGAPLTAGEIAACHEETCDYEDIWTGVYQHTPEQIRESLCRSILNRWQPPD